MKMSCTNTAVKSTPIYEVRPVKVNKYIAAENAVSKGLLNRRK